MLQLEYLLEEAKANGMPVSKKRGIIREYLQVIILNSMYKHPLGGSIFFTGGTALRFAYHMPRFSEDLDFDTRGLNVKDLRELLEYVKSGLRSEGFSVDIHLEKRGRLYVAQLDFKDVMRLYELSDKRGQDVMIKIEIYQPRWNIFPEPAVLSLYGYNFSFVMLEKGCIFSEKLCALFNRKRGRDIYDALFMLKKKFPFSEEVLKANKVKVSPKDALLTRLKSLTQKELVFLANQVKPFLFKEDDIELILKAPLYAENFLEIS